MRIRIGNLSMTNHPIHLHGYAFKVTCTDGGWVAPSAQWPEVTIDVPVGAMRAIEFVAEEEGDWAFHCHKSHHTMGPMGHEVRSEEHTSALPSLMRTSYAVFCLTQKNTNKPPTMQ